MAPNDETIINVKLLPTVNNSLEYRNSFDRTLVIYTSQSIQYIHIN